MANLTDKPKGPGVAKRLDSFAGLGERELSALFRLAPIKQLKRGDILINEGETDQTVYIILDGLVTVVKDLKGQAVEIATLIEGDWVGEIAFTKRIPRTASVVAKTAASVMAINRSILDALEAKTQLFIYTRLNDLAAERVANLSARESELLGQNYQLMSYIRSARQREGQDYQNSGMLRSVISKIPRLPAFASTLAGKLLDINVAPNEVVEEIKADPALVAMILKAVNSPYYGLERKVSDIHQAVLILGYNQVYQLVLSEGVSRSMPDSPSFHQLQAHAVAIANLAFIISQESRIGRPTQAATIGLLHDLGQGVIDLLKERNPSLAMLLDALDTAQIGAMLLKTWNLPILVYKSVEYQFNPEFMPPNLLPEDLRSYVAILYLGHQVHDLLSERPAEEMVTTFLADYLSFLGWSGLPLKEVVHSRLVPALLKKGGALPASFRNMILKLRQKGTP